MEEAVSQRWFLRKHEDGNVFGPLPFQQVARWAATARISPHDSLSIDQQTWMKAPMLPELGMDWLVEMTSESYYGPTTLGAIQEFVRLGEIDDETFVINACDGARQRLAELELPQLLPENEASAEGDWGEPGDANEPSATGISLDLHDRIRDLEQSLSEERRALRELEQRYAELEARYNELTQQYSPEASL